MRADLRYTNLDLKFWANVRTIGQEIGYSKRKKVLRYDLDDLLTAMNNVGLGKTHLKIYDQPSELADLLLGYLNFRSTTLNTYVEPMLMDAEEAEAIYDDLPRFSPSSPQPMNKQRGDKKRPAYLTCIVNTIIEAYSAGIGVDYDPRILTTVTRDHEPFRTLSRRVDGCFPSCVNPIAVWEIKEYYYTTFGSRIADGVYETLLDGFELQELRSTGSFRVDHLLIIDSHRTWWEMGLSFLCRLVDMLHMGYVDEILFGSEVVETLPEIVRTWVEQYQARLQINNPT